MYCELAQFVIDVTWASPIPVTKGVTSFASPADVKMVEPQIYTQLGHLRETL